MVGPANGAAARGPNAGGKICRTYLEVCSTITNTLQLLSLAAGPAAQSNCHRCLSAVRTWRVLDVVVKEGRRGESCTGAARGVMDDARSPLQDGQRGRPASFKASEATGKPGKKPAVQPIMALTSASTVIRPMAPKQACLSYLKLPSKIHLRSSRARPSQTFRFASTALCRAPNPPAAAPVRWQLLAMGQLTLSAASYRVATFVFEPGARPAIARKTSLMRPALGSHLMKRSRPKRLAASHAWPG